MAETPSSLPYCPACGTENVGEARLCRECGRPLMVSPQQRRRNVTFFLSELESLRAQGAISEGVYLGLRDRYRRELGETAEPPAPVPAATAPRGLAPPRAPKREGRRPEAKREGPGWLVEQQANLLLYLGAFLIVIATLVFVSASGESIPSGVRMALLIAGTLAFLAAGLFCLPRPRVRQAGVAFFAVGALMVPLNFVGAYAFFFSDEEIDPAGLWLAGSLTSVLFYGAVSWLGMGRWYPVPMIGAMISGLGAVLALLDAPAAAYPASYIALAFVLATPSALPLRRVNEVFGLAGSWGAHAMVPLAFLAALLSAEGIEAGEQGWLAASLIAGVFYAATALLGLGRLDVVERRWYGVPLVVAALSSLAAVLALLDAPAAAYAGSYIALAFVFATPSALPLRRVSEVFGTAGSWAAHGIVPLAFLAALLAAGEIEAGMQGWLAASLIAVIFYVATALLGLGRLDVIERRWYGVPLVVAAFSSLAAALVLADAPPEVYPGSFIGLAFVLTILALFPLGRLSEALEQVAPWAAHAVVAPAMVVALTLTLATGERFEFDLLTRWYLPPTAAMATLFYWTQAAWARRSYPEFEPYLTVAALAVSGGGAITLVYALDVGHQWYGPAVAALGWLYASGSERFGPPWFGRRYLGWMALGAVTVSWLFFEGIYDDFPRYGAGVHFAAAILYLAAARLGQFELAVDAGDAFGRREDEPYRVPGAVGLIYAAGLTIGIGFYHLLSSLPAAETAEASDLSLAFFGLSLGAAAVAATMRLWWPELRLHGYAIAAGMSLFVLLSSLDAEGQITWMLASYTGLALALTLWEREPRGLAVPAGYGFFALLAAWRLYEPVDAYLPLTMSTIGYGLFAGYLLLRSGVVAHERAERWSISMQVLAFAYVAAAPIVGWVRLAMLADDAGFVGTSSFEETALYQTAAASVMLLGLLLALQYWFLRRWELLAGASALLMVALLLEVGHFRPENVQAYTAPLGVYLFAAGLLASRVGTLPRDVRDSIEALEVVGAALIVVPSLAQSFDDGAWRYGVIVLAEGLGFVAVALVRRRVWLLSASVGFVVLDGLHYLFFAGGPALPGWAILAIAGVLVMAAGTAILFGRERWGAGQRVVQAWWHGEPLPSEVE